MAFDKHTTRKKEIPEDEQNDAKQMKKKKPFEEGTRTDKGDKGKNLDSYDKEQKNDKELVEKK
jgi:hypothetical protein